ncbi:MAG: NADH-quinone oxidoreductase subunit M [Sphingobacteriales bacterium]|jgi:NADH-quinone oxidoreductase subunit M
MGLLTLIILLPLIGMIISLVISKKVMWIARIINPVVALGQIVVWFMLNRFTPNVENGFKYIESLRWINLSLGDIGSLKIDYLLGADGLTMALMGLSIIIFFFAGIASIKTAVKPQGFFALMLLLNASIMGVFCSLDLFLFFVFFEFMLLPLYFLIGIWGGPRREYAALKFFLYTLVGSVFLLLVFVGLYLSFKSPETGSFSFSYFDLSNPENALKGSLFHPDGMLFGFPAREVGFFVLLIAFCIKIPAFPFHTWLPDAHVEAPTAVSMVLAGVVLKVGAYGLIRFGYGLFPDVAFEFSYWVGLLGVISIIYGAFNALAMKDIKKMIAYSSISHMGFVLLGLASITIEGWSGAFYQMISHGFLSAMLFFIAGVFTNRVQSREIDKFSGLTTLMPRFGAFVTIAFFASLGLPGFSAFIAEIMVLFGAFGSESINQLVPRWMAIAATGGIILGAAYFLWTLQRMFFGKPKFENPEWKEKLTDLTTIEWLVLLPLAIFALVLGVFPQVLVDIFNNTVILLIDQLAIS